MKIRLVIPECRKWDNTHNWICEDSYNNIFGRIQILRWTMQCNVNLVVTSNNFLSFPIIKTIHQDCYRNSDCFRHRFLEPVVIRLLNQEIECKKPLIIGFDLLTEVKGKKEKSISKRRKKSNDSELNTNPCGGIPAIVLYLTIRNNQFQYGKHIWESWDSPNICNQNCFRAQNRRRIINVHRKRIGLLSCGDIARYCHNNGQFLPNVDVYVDLSHKSLTGQTPQHKIPSELTGGNKCNYVFLTHQVRRDKIRSYYRNQNYPWIFPQSTQFEVNCLQINGNMAGVIDVYLP